ncbi:dTDP-4-dehydrorhamnose reductase [soil metagenome]
MADGLPASFGVKNPRNEMPNIYDRVLMTGGGGMLAHALVSVLHRRGVQPVVLARAQLDIADALAMSDVRHQNPSLILNCAAYTKVDQCEIDEEAATRTNSMAPSLLAQTAKQIGAEIVHYSTDFVFNGRSTLPYRPDDTTDALSNYGASKWVGEQLVHRSGASHLIIRTSWLYGPNGPNFVQTMLNAARAGKALTVVDDQIGSPTFTHDLAEATLDLIDHGATGIYHATNSGQTTWFEFAKAIFEEFEVPNVNLKPISSAKWKETHPASATRPAYSALDCSETERLIGRKMPDWRDALHRYHLLENPKFETRNPNQ